MFVQSFVEIGVRLGTKVETSLKNNLPRTSGGIQSEIFILLKLGNEFLESFWADVTVLG